VKYKLVYNHFITGDRFYILISFKNVEEALRAAQQTQQLCGKKVFEFVCAERGWKNFVPKSTAISSSLLLM